MGQEPERPVRNEVVVENEIEDEDDSDGEEEEEEEEEGDEDDEDDDDEDEDDDEAMPWNDEDEEEIKVFKFPQSAELLPNFPVFRVKYAGFPEFKIKGRLRSSEYFLCSECHDGVELKPRPIIRELRKEHTNINLEHIKQEHGTEKFWCTICHDTSRPDYLVGLKKQSIHFDQSFLLCGQCHSQNQKDWLFGAHGKRTENWNGERTILLCTECHSPHTPALEPAPPNPPPPARQGQILVKSVHPEGPRKTWDKFIYSKQH